MVIQFIGDWFSFNNDDLGYKEYSGMYPSNGGSFTVVWESDTEIDVSLCNINYNYRGTNDIFPAYLVSEVIGSNRVERTYVAPYKYGVCTINGAYIEVEAFYGDDMLALLSYHYEYVFMFADAMGVATVRNGLSYETVIKGALIGYAEYPSNLYERTPGAFINITNSTTNRPNIYLSTIYGGIELTGGFATSSSGDASVFFKAKNVLSIDFIDGYSYRYDDYRYYKMPSIGLGETRMVKVRVSSNNGFPVTGEKVTGRLRYMETTEIERVSYTDYGTYTEVDFELNLNTNPDYTQFLVSYEDDNYLLTDRSTTANLGTIYPTNLLIFEEAPLWSTIPSEIEEDTDISISVTYPNGGNLTFNTPDDVIITIDSETDNGNGTTTATGTIRVNEENTASQITISISDGANTINKTINILEKEPPMATPTISINRYADLAFPAEGGTKYITITYTNTQVSLINTPYSTAYGTTITPRTTTEIDNGVEIYYAVTVTANTYERTIPLIFSCSNAQGTSTTETFTGTQAGESPNTGDAYINLDYTQHQFPASGGTFDVLATYSYPVSGKSLSVTVRNATVNTNITWCKAELIGGQIDDDWTEGNERWRITMNPGLDNTEPMSARIIFSYTDSRGGTASAEFIATREAGTTTGTQSSLSVYRTQMRFTADGEFSFNDPVCTVGYKYTNEEDIEDPVVEGDWIVVTEGEHETRAGEILISWNVAVARNVTTASRTGTITFRAIGQDDVEHEGVCIIMQAGADDVEETFEWVDFLWKDNAVTLDGTDITFRLLDGYDEIYTGRIQQRPDADTNFFFINKIVQDYVYMEEIPALLDGTSDYQLHENGYKTFRLDSPDTVGAMRSYKFKYDWSYTDTSSFILSESIIPYVVEGQKNLITYCNLDYYGASTDLYTWIKADGNVVNGAITAEPEEYATKVVEMPENARNYVLSGQKYEVISPCQAKYVLYYLSPKGGWCWFPIMGKVEVSDRLTSFTLSGNYDNTTTQFGKKRYTVDIATDYNLSTGFLTESQSLRMWEMLESNMVYMHDMEKDVVFPVLMKQDTVEKKRYQRGQTKMLSYSFGVETSQGRMRI